MATDGPLGRVHSLGGGNAGTGAGSELPFVDSTGRTHALAVFLDKALPLNPRGSWSAACGKPMPAGDRLHGLLAPEHTARPASGAWLRAMRRYLLCVAFANLAWEIAHLPLYTLWQEGSFGEIAFAVVHCTAGDVLIATASLVLALLLFAERRWPDRGFQRVAAAAVAFGAGYTIFSEWLNTEVRGSWTYTDRMPVLPILGTGLSPLVQWLALPTAAFWWARRPTTHIFRSTDR